jgi:uncharacterized protein GlcG (DUF336 family)
MALTVEKMYAGIQAGMAKAAGMGQKMSFCIMDEGGHVKIVVQGDGARWNTVDIAIGKAYTAVSFRRGTDALFELAQKVPGFSGLETLFGGKVIMLPGGMRSSRGGRAESFSVGRPLSESEGRATA